MSQVLTASFAIRLHTVTQADLHPAATALGKAIQEKAPHTWKWIQAVSKHPSVTNIYNEQVVIESTRKRLEKAKAAA
jgi:glutathione S-transferase